MLIIVSPTIIPARNALQFNTSGPDRPGPAPKFAVERTLSLQGSHRGSRRHTRASYTPGLVNVCLRAVAQSHGLTRGVRGTTISICNSIFPGSCLRAEARREQRQKPFAWLSPSIEGEAHAVDSLCKEPGPA